MKNKKIFIILILIIVVVLVGVLLVVRGSQDKGHEQRRTENEPQILYYTCGMHPSVKVSAEEFNKGNTLCPICNMKLVPVYKEEESKIEVEESKILFYRHPMNPEITSREPAKDDMGMDFIPVYEEGGDEDTTYYGCGMEGQEHVFSIKGVKGMTCPICAMPLKELSGEEASKLKGVVGRVKIKQSQVELAGVETTLVRKLQLYKEIRTVGKVAYDPPLAIAQEEFISALKALAKIQEGRVSEIIDRASNLVESSRRKLRLLGLSQDQIKELEETKEIHTNLILPEKKMWIYGQVYEYELSWVRVGERIKVSTSSIPGEEFHGVIVSINPVLDPKTRSVRFRAEVDNPQFKLQPEMYVDVMIESMYMLGKGEHKVLAISKQAVLDTGIRRIVWVEKRKGEYEGRLVRIGPEASARVDGVSRKFYPVLSGVSEGELVVEKANFLIDSQSQLSGVAASAYGGALEAEEASPKTAPPLHQH